MDTFLTESTVRNTLAESLEDGEQLGEVARGTDLLGRPVFVGKTDRRGLILRLSRSFVIKDEQAVPLAKLDKRLKRLALVKGVILAPPGEPAFRADSERALFETERAVLTKFVEEGESIVTIGLFRKPGLGDQPFYYIGFTNARLIVALLSAKREIEDVETIPLDALEYFELKHGPNTVPIDRPVITGQEERLIIKFRSGGERSFLLTDLSGHRREDAPD